MQSPQIMDLQADRRYRSDNRPIWRTPVSTGTTDKPRFAIFRAKDARSDTEISLMKYEEVTSVLPDGAQRAAEVGVNEGQELRTLFAVPGFSLTYVWFKSGFPLPRHSHNVDCLYYIVGGSFAFW